MSVALLNLTACTITQQAPEDMTLERAIERAIQTGPGTSSANASITVTVQNGVAILHGSVEKGIDKILAEKVVKGVEGVTEVRNYIFVD